jgi:hypothetical protein
MSPSQIINSHGEYWSHPMSRKSQGIAAPIIAGLAVLLVGLLSGFVIEHSNGYETQPDFSDAAAIGTVSGNPAAFASQVRDTTASAVNENQSGIERLDDQTKILIALCVVVVSGAGLALSTRKPRH